MTRAPRAPATAPTAAAPRRAGEWTVPWPLRLLAWLVALPLGLAAVLWPARQFEWLSGQRLLDVLIGTGWSRYLRVLAIAPVWALVTTILVRLMYVGFRRLAARRRMIGAERRQPAAVSNTRS